MTRDGVEPYPGVYNSVRDGLEVGRVLDPVIASWAALGLPPEVAASFDSGGSPGAGADAVAAWAVDRKPPWEELSVEIEGRGVPFMGLGWQSGMVLVSADVNYRLAIMDTEPGRSRRILVPFEPDDADLADGHVDQRLT